MIQLRPLIPPKGASQLACPVGEALGPCIGGADFVSWGRPARECPRTRSTTNPPPTEPARLTWQYRATSYCIYLAPASFVVTTAASVKTDIGTLNDNSGIEIMVPPAQVPALDAALARSFKKPLAFVADGQIVAIDDVQPTSGEYQSTGGVLIYYGSADLISKVNQELRSKRTDDQLPRTNPD